MDLLELLNVHRVNYRFLLSKIQHRSHRRNDPP